MMHPRGTEIRFPGNHSGFARAFAGLRDVLDAQCLAGAARYNVELVFEEIVSNVVRHAALHGGELQVLVTLEHRPDSIILTFEDDGVPFDPRGQAAPAQPKSLEDAPVGGFGLMLVRRAASSLDYVRTAKGCNRLTVRMPCGDAVVPGKV